VSDIPSPAENTVANGVWICFFHIVCGKNN